MERRDQRRVGVDRCEEVVGGHNAVAPRRNHDDLEAEVAREPRGGLRHGVVLETADHDAAARAGAPAFGMNSKSWDYGTYTWHTNRDTYDKLVTNDLRANATLIAMLAYMASEETDRIPRTKRDLPVDARTGVPATWPECTNPDRRFVR